MSNSTSSDERSSDPKAWRFFRPIIVISAEIASIMVILGSAFSVIVHSILFRKWGINFLSIVSVNDLILSALDVIFIIAIFSIFVLPIANSAFSVSKWLKTKISVIYTNVIYIFLIIVWVGIFAFFPMTQTLNMFAEIFPTGWMYLFLGVGAALLGIGAQKSVSEKLHWQSANTCFTIFVCIVCSMTALFSIYEGRIDLFVKFEKPIRGCHKPKAVWIGSQSIVARCYKWENKSYQIGEYLVVERSQALLLSPATWDQQFYPDPRINSRSDFYQEN